MKKPVLLLMSLLFFSLIATGCGNQKEQSATTNDERITVYTTVYPLQYFTERIGGEYVRVETVYPPGADEHTYEPSQKDIIKIAEADLFFYIGFGLEGFADKAEKSLANEDVTFVAAGERIRFAEEHGEDGNHEEEHHHHHDDGHHHGVIDPHVWIDPVYAKQLAATIKDELAKKMPEQEEIFNKNYEILAGELDSLDKRFHQLVDKAKIKKFIVSHAAYGYWEKRYGLKQISIAGISSSSEPSQKELANIVKTAETHGLKYVFFEQNIPSKLTEIVRDAIKGESLTLHNLAVLTEEDIKNNRDYFSIMEDNLKALEKGLTDTN